MARNAMKKKEPQRINADAPFSTEPHNGWGSKHPHRRRSGHLAISAPDESIRTPAPRTQHLCLSRMRATC